ncbi:MAG: ABC transporter ATP-binding protein [Chitinophagales bacterium]|nr:ABC transporter ATP-binding protein [Chitinophagales bacterium]
MLLSNKNILEVAGLLTQFSSDTEVVTAVNGISFHLEYGETLGIVGESGSGKSVTSLSIMRLIPPAGKISGGKILFAKSGQQPIDLLKLSENQIRRYRGKEMAMIFQEPMTSLNPVFTCGDQVTEAITLHLKNSKSEAREKTLMLFEKVRLPDPKRIFKAYPHQLSGGQKQRVMIAMAMSCTPSILIADEPTTALDVTVQAHILELMRQLREENNMSMIFITHDLGVVAEVADRVAVMYKGEIVEQASVEEIFSNPRHPYTKGLLACRPPLNKKLRRLSVIPDFMVEDKEGHVKELEPKIHEVRDDNIISAADIEERHHSLMQQEPILTVRNLKTYFPLNKNIFGKSLSYVKAVDDVSFEVFPGETLGLVGESGCGKTTLGRSILQLIRPTSGEVIFEGKNLVDLPDAQMREVRRRLQIIFQDPYSSLNPRLTVGFAIMEPMKVHGMYENDKMRRERVLDLLDKVNMPPSSYNRFPHEFSGGQRQRICIARALALNPRFIVCDESVSALDVSVQAQVLNLLLQLRDQFQFSYIFISHDLSVVKFMSDRMVVMNDGKIEEMGKADEVYNNPSSDYTRKLISAIPKGYVKAVGHTAKK